MGNTTLKDQYLALYNIVRHKSDTLATVMQSSGYDLRPPDGVPDVLGSRPLVHGLGPEVYH